MVVICDQQFLASLQGAAAIVTAPRSCITAIGNIAAYPSSQRARRVLYAPVSSSSIGESSLLLGMEKARSRAIIGGALNLVGGATAGEGNHWAVGLLSVVPVPLAVVVWPTVSHHVELNVALGLGL